MGHTAPQIRQRRLAMHMESAGIEACFRLSARPHDLAAGTIALRVFPGGRETSQPSRRRITFRRFLIGWTLLAVVAWLYFASTGPGEMGCRKSDFVCFSQRDVDLIAALVVGIPWLLGLLVAGVVMGLVKWFGRRHE